MELTILGTAAAEAWPAPFCRCDACQEARRRGGPNLRSRSGAILDNDFKIDFGPDTVMQLIRQGRDLQEVRTLVFTHHHCDHIVPTELEWANANFTNTPPATPIAVYGNEAVIQMLHNEFSHHNASNLDFQPALQAFHPVTTATGDIILPLPADHAPGSFVLRITRAKDGKSLFYGHDSGLYPAETLDALTKAGTLDIAVFDCTFGGKKTANRGHMDIDGVVQMAETLRERGVITPQTHCIASHFSHNGNLMHEELVQAFLPHRIQVAFDGIVIRA